MVRQFNSCLKRLGVHRPTGVEVSAMDLIPIYVSLGSALVFRSRFRGAKVARDLKIVPLPNFPPLIVAALWRKNLSPSNAAFLAQIRQRAQEVERQILE